MDRLYPIALRIALASLIAALAGCASLPADHRVGDHSAPASLSRIADAWAHTGSDAASEPPAQWDHQRFPGKAPTEFTYVRKDGRDAVAAVAKSSVSMKRRKLHLAPQALGAVRFSWSVPALIAQADMARRDLDDSPVRVVLVFEGDRSRFSPGDAMLSELARTLTGEEMPYATLMYVWCNQRATGEVIVNPRTSRIRKMVVESGSGNLGRWLSYERDVRADYERAFGEPPGALVGVGIMTDSDNTRSTVRAWYGPVRVSSNDRQLR